MIRLGKHRRAHVKRNVIGAVLLGVAAIAFGPNALHDLVRYVRISRM